MPTLNLIEELFIVASPDDVRSVVCCPQRWARWLPGVRLTAYDDRGPLGVRWTVTGTLVGTGEVWLEAYGDGVIVHAFLRVDPAPGARRRRSSPRRLTDAYELPLKRGLFDAKRLLEGDREPGGGRAATAEQVVSASDGGQCLTGAGERPPRPQRRAGTGKEGAAPDG